MLTVVKLVGIDSGKVFIAFVESKAGALIGLRHEKQLVLRFGEERLADERLNNEKERRTRGRLGGVL